MSDKIPVTVIMTTYDKGDGSRTIIAKKTLDSLFDNLDYPNLRWIVVDDDSPQHAEHMAGIVGEHTGVKILKTMDHAGVGNAKNIALKEAWNDSPIVLLMEDDWWLPAKFSILPHVQVLLDHDDIGMIRLGYIGGDGLIATYFAYELFRNYWRLQRGSNVYIYSGQVSLRHKRFYDSVGYHDEQCAPGEEELKMCIRFNGTDNAPDILWPGEYCPMLNCSPFKNIGLDPTLSLNAVTPGV